MKEFCFLLTWVLYPFLYTFKEPQSVLLEKVNKKKIGDKAFYLVDDIGNVNYLIWETLTFTMMLSKNKTFLVFLLKNK